jgi:hypothetical protein
MSTVEQSPIEIEIEVKQGSNFQAAEAHIIHTDHNGLAVEAVFGLATIDTDDNGTVEVDVESGSLYLVRIDGRDMVVPFQNGTVSERGVNGLTNEALLAILIHRTTVLNNKFPCAENQDAITHMQAALTCFEARTNRRIAKGIEGQLTEDPVAS